MNAEAAEASWSAPIFAAQVKTTCTASGCASHLVEPGGGRWVRTQARPESSSLNFVASRVRDKQEPELKDACWTAKLNGSYSNHDTATATVSKN